MAKKMLSPQSNVAFLINSHSDWQYAIELLDSIKRLYPAAKILVIDDGYRAELLEQKCEGMGATYILGRRLKTRHDNAWSIRMFQHLRTLDSDYVVKLDPDCLLHDHIQIPDSFDVCARLYGKNHKKLIGPCIVFTREAINKIWESGLLLEGEYIYKPSRLVNGEKYHSQDLLLQSIIETLGLVQKELPNVWIDWIMPPDDGQYCLVHPRVDSVALIGWSCYYPRQGEGSGASYPALKAKEYFEVWAKERAS